MSTLATCPAPAPLPAAQAQTHESQRAELAQIIARHCPHDGTFDTPIAGLHLFRGSSTGAPSCSIISSVFAMLAQGAKRLLVADDAYDYDARHYLVSSVDLPILARISEASPQRPYLGLALDIDPLKIGELTAALPQSYRSEPLSRAIGVDSLNVDIQNAALRLLRLLDTPDDILVLAPIVERELLYRVLTGSLGARLRQAAAADSHSHQIVRAIGWLKDHLDQPFSMTVLTDVAGMSKSSLHQHFKQMTGMTPLQYHKQLRLQEARRLMLANLEDAASAAHRVGYESASQFSREYRRMFGAPPARDIAQLRNEQGETRCIADDPD